MARYGLEWVAEGGGVDCGECWMIMVVKMHLNGWERNVLKNFVLDGDDDDVVVVLCLLSVF